MAHFGQRQDEIGEIDMPTLFFTYRPKPGVPFEEFQRFLEEVDQPATLALPSTIASAIYRSVEPEEDPHRSPV